MKEESKDTTETPKPVEWEHKEEFALNAQLRRVLSLTVAATESELAALRRKLQKLHYGS